MSGILGSFLGSPFGFAMLIIESGMDKGKATWRLIIPSIVAASVGYTAYFLLTAHVFGNFFQLPTIDGWKFRDLGYAVILGLIGGLLGLVFIYLFRGVKRCTRRWQSRPIELGLLSGLMLGVVGAFFPIVLFPGDAQVQVLINDAAALGILTLVILAFLKIFVTVVCLSMGWSGGYIFPAFFIGGAAGLAIHQVLPFIPMVICMACVISGVSVALLRAPIAMTLIVQALFDIRLAPVIAIAILVSFLLTYRIDLVPSENKDGPGHQASIEAEAIER